MLEWNPLTIAVVVLIVVYIIGSEVLKKYLDMKIEMFYTAEMYQEAIDLLDKIYTRILFSTFKQYYLRFTIYEADGNNKAAELMLEHLLNMRVSKKRRLALVLQAFNFYVMNGHRKDAQGMLDEIKASGNQAVIADSQLTYDIVLGKRCDKIDQMEGMLQQADPQTRAKLYLLLEHQYATKGDKRNAAKYRNLSHKLVEAHRVRRPQDGAKR